MEQKSERMTDPTNTIPTPYQSGRLKPCPFCQSEDIQAFDIGETFILYCNDCCASGPEADTLEDAVEKWNRRMVE